MKAKRKRHEPEFKARVAFEAIKGVKTVQEIAKEYEVHPVQISMDGKGLVLDLNADTGIEAEDGSRVYTWRNQVEAVVADIFLKQDEWRRVLVCSLKGDMKIWADHYRV